MLSIAIPGGGKGLLLSSKCVAKDVSWSPSYSKRYSSSGGGNDAVRRRSQVKMRFKVEGLQPVISRLHSAPLSDPNRKQELTP